MQNHPALSALEDFGLSEKEARTYLASLALGPAVIADIAIKAELTRPTTYLMVDSLKARGLMTEHRKGKKTLMKACDPDKLRQALDQEKEELERREQATADLIDAIGTAADDDDDIDVRLIDSDEAEMMLRESCRRAKQPVRAVFDARNAGGQWVTALLNEDWLAQHPQVEYRAVVQGGLLEALPPAVKARLALPERDIAAAIVIVGSELFCDYLTDRTKRLYLRNEAIAQTIRTMFDAAYDESKTSH